MSTDRKTSSISIIVPALNEAASISQHLPELLAVPGIEVIVVDGCSKDSTADTAEALGAKVLQVASGRAQQMNAGAKVARGEILLFLHADTRLTPGFVDQVSDALNQAGTVAGAFRLAIAGKGLGYRMIEWLANLRSMLWQMPYGDQGIFLTAQMFSNVGSFPPLPIMEDFELVRRLKRLGHIKILPLFATTSPRRWEKLGLLRTTAINQAVILGYFLGVKPQKLSNWYRRDIFKEKTPGDR